MTVSSELTSFPDFTFPHHQQVFRIERHVSDLQGQPLRSEVVYGVTSLPREKASPERLLALVRGHWEIENSLHYLRDVVFGEDKSTTRKGAAPKVMATLRNLVINIFRLTQRTAIAEALRHFSWKPSRSISLLGF